MLGLKRLDALELPGSPAVVELWMWADWSDGDRETAQTGGGSDKNGAEA